MDDGLRIGLKPERVGPNSPLITSSIVNRQSSRFGLPSSHNISIMSDKCKVLITGAAGRIGSYYRQHAADMYDLRLHDIRSIGDPGPFEAMTGNLADPAEAAR